MARNKTIKPDQFSASIEELFGEILDAGYEGALEGVQGGIRAGGKLWRKHAKDRIGEHEYMRHGKVYTSGMYARSICSHMLSKDPKHPVGEIGSRKLYGLTHLLQEGHARVGGGRVDPVLELDKAVAPGAFQAAVDAAKAAIEHGLS